MEHPIDRSRVAHVRLVDNNGHIRSDGFYNYLTAWISNDLLPYDISQATIRPIGKEWIYVPRDSDLLIPKSPAISFARMPFFLHNLGSTEQVGVFDLLFHHRYLIASVLGPLIAYGFPHHHHHHLA